MRFHVLPGDSVVEEFRASGIDGEVIVFRECLLDGPVSTEADEEFWRQRALFIEQAYGSTAVEYKAQVAGEIGKLLDIPKGSEVNLWFEYELFCQVNMWFCLSILKETDSEVFRVEPAVREKHDVWKGFGSLDAEHLRECYGRREAFTRDDLELGRQLWIAFSTSDHAELLELAKTGSPRFPYLLEVCQAESVRSHRPKEILDEVSAAGVKDFPEIFKEFSARAGVYGFGDTQVRRLLDGS